MSKTTAVRWHFSATHRQPGGDLHGHTWSVKARWPAGRDALALQDQLRCVLSNQFDERELPDHLSRGEDIAEAIGEALLGCVRVDLARKPEGIYATWIRD